MMDVLPPPPRRYGNELQRGWRSLGAVALVLCMAALIAVPFEAIHAAGGIRTAFGYADLHVPLAVGSVGIVPEAGVRITLLTVSGNQFLPYAGGAPIKQWSAEMTIENTSSRARTLAPWRLRGKDGHEYTPVSTIGGTTGGMNLPEGATLLPAQTLRGTVTFRVPQDVTARWLRYGTHDPRSPDLSFDTP